MIRLILLLLGPKPLREHHWVFFLLAIASLILGIIFIADLFHDFITVFVDILGVLLFLEGGRRLLFLAAAGFPNATIPVLKSLLFVALGLLTFDTTELDDNIVSAIVIGSLLTVDGIFRIVAAYMIRSERWRLALAIAAGELVLATLIWTPWPVPYRHSVPLCIGIVLVLTAWSLFRLALQLRRLPPGASVTTLPFFAGPNWHGRGIINPSLNAAGNYENSSPLLVHVWTPVGGAVEPQHRPIVDRYIAAIDKGGTISTGHAALSLPPDTYVSLCPADEMNYAPDDFRKRLRASTDNNVRGRFRPSFEEECNAWQRPDREVNFSRYNETALKAFLAEYRQQEIYNLTSRNCSSTVALSLDAAVEGVLGHYRPWRTLLLLLIDPAMWLAALWRTKAEAMTWTPGLVLDYATALKNVVEQRRYAWLSRLRETERSFEEQRRTQLEEAKHTQSVLPSIISLVATALIFGLTYGLSAPLIALSLTQLGYGEGFIGANAAMHAVGVLAIATFLPAIAWRFGAKLPIAISLLVAATILAMFPQMPSIWLWFPLRIALGAASETMFVMSETWLAHLSNEATRTRTMAIYTTALSLGFALGPMILAAVGSQGETPFVIGSVVALIALGSIAMPWVRNPSFAKPEHRNPLRYLWLAPVAVAATLVNAAVETAGMSFLPLYAMQAGWAEQSATTLLSVLLLGAIVMQLPIGWLGDHMDKRRLVIVLGALSTAGALAWPYVLGSPYVAYPLLFVWGGLFVGIYTVMMAHVGSRFQGGDLVTVYTIMSIAWGFGAFVGPSTAGASMEFATHGLPYFAAIACAAFTVLAIVRR